MNDKLKNACRKVYDELSVMSYHEFISEIEKHKDGEISKMIKELIENGWSHFE